MKNQDKPINAVFTQHGTMRESGLTKLEYTAIQAMNGILSAQTEIRANGNSLSEHEVKWISEESIILAKQLLNQLEKE